MENKPMPTFIVTPKGRENKAIPKYNKRSIPRGIDPNTNPYLLLQNLMIKNDEPREVISDMVNGFVVKVEGLK
jgi:hypothetical protein